MAEEAILGYLEKSEEISDSGNFATEFGINHEEIVNVVKSLNGYGLVVAQVILFSNCPTLKFAFELAMMIWIVIWNSSIDLK